MWGIHIVLFFQYVENNKTADNDWFRLESNKEGTRSVLLLFLRILTCMHIVFDACL